MEKGILLKAVIMWFLFLPVPIINGGLRDFWYKAKIGEKKSEIIGSTVLIFFFLLYVHFFFKNDLPGFSRMQLFLLGFLWTAMTFIFESALGLRRKMGWKEIFAQYDLSKGRLWPLVMLAIFLSPFLVSIFLK